MGIPTHFSGRVVAIVEIVRPYLCVRCSEWKSESGRRRHHVSYAQTVETAYPVKKGAEGPKLEMLVKDHIIL